MAASRDKLVEVVGVGAAEVSHDRVSVRLGAEARAATVVDAFSEANAALERMTAVLREHVAAGDLQSTGVEVHQDFEKGSGPAEYRASLTLQVTVPDMARVGDVLAGAVDAGGDASRVHGLALTTASTSDAMTAARGAAWADARAKAEQYAELAGLALGPVLRVHEGGRDVSHPAAAQLVSYRLEPGSTRIHASVTVRWRLQQPARIRGPRHVL